jgi:hypothetical protein
MQKPYDLTLEDYAILAKYRRPPRSGPAPIDSQRTPAFQPGADGKLHPVPGWKTTGPFDVGTWAKNIDWAGVVRDGVNIGAGAGAVTFPGVAGQIAGLWGVGREALDELEDRRISDPSKRR